MAFEQKPGTGFLFKNEDRQGQQPNTRGTLMTPDGKLWEIAGWTKQSEKAGTFISLKAQKPTPKDEPKQSQGQDQNQPVNDDDIPF